MMTNEALEMEARLKDYISGNIEKIEKQIDQFGKSADQDFKKATKGANTFMDTVKGFVSAQAIIGATRKAFGMLTTYINGSVDAYKEEEKANALLTEQLGYTSKAIKDQASALQKVTTFGDEATVMAAAQVAAFTKDEKAIQLLLPVIQDLAVGAFKGQLEPAASLVAKTMGSSTNALSRYGIEVEGAVGSSERLESIINGISKAYGGQAEALGKTDLGKLEIQKSLLSDQAEILGKQIIPFQIEWNRLLLSTNNIAVPFLTTLIKGTGLVGKLLTGNLDIERERLNNWIDQKKNAEDYAAILSELSKKEKELLGQKYLGPKVTKLREEIKILRDALTTKGTVGGGGGGGETPDSDLIKKNKDVSEWLKQNAGATNTIINKMDEKGFADARKIMEQAHTDEIEMVSYQNDMLAKLEENKYEIMEELRIQDFQKQIAINEKKKEEISDFSKWWTEDTEKRNATLMQSGAMLTDAIVGGIRDQILAGAKSEGEKKKAAKKAAIISWQMGMGGAAASIWSTPGGTWYEKLIEMGAIQTALTTQFGFQMNQISKAARGADFETRGRQLLMVGDNPGGRERVSVTPISSSNMNGPKSGGNMTIDASVNIPQGAYIDRAAGEMIVSEQRKTARRLERVLSNGYLDQFVSDMKAR